MKRKIKKLLLTSCCLTMMLSGVIGIFLNKVSVEAETVSSILDGKNIAIEYGYANDDGRKGLLISTQNDTGFCSLERKFVGGFEMEFETLYNADGKYGAGHIAFDFISDSGNSFSLHIERDGNLSSAYVEAEGEKMGINRQNTGFTALLNKSDIYTELVSSASYTVTFNPSEMKVYVNSILVWDFSEENNDGRNVGFSYDSFQTYNVGFSISEIADEARILTYQINGEELSGSVLKDTSGPAIFVEKVSEAVVGKAYQIPQATAYDFTYNKDISEVSFEVYAPNGDKVALTGDSKEAFIPEQEGAYVILYKAKDEKGNTGVYSLNVQANTTYNSEIVLGGYLSSQAPKNSELTIPCAVVVSDIFDYQFNIRYANVSVLLNGTEIDGLSGEANEAKTLRITQAGEYKVIYTYKQNGLEECDEYVVNATEYGYTDFFVSEFYATGEELQIPAVSYFNGTNNVPATAVLTLPSGETVTGEKIVFEEIGEYSLNYIASAETEAQSISKTFTVTYESSDLFDVTYGKIATGYSSINNDLFGVQASLTQASTITYKNVIDFTGKTQDDIFLELIATPSKYYNVDFTQFLIRLTDTEDPNNWVEIKAFDMASNRADGTYVRARRNGTAYVAAQDGYKTIKPTNPGYGGYPVLHSFRGNVNNKDYKGQTLKFSFDPTTKMLYSDSNGMDSNKYGTILADLCDPTWCGEWDGFTNNTAYLTITCASIVTSANFAILTVDGKDLTNENGRTISNHAPKLTILEQNCEVMPKGVVGMEYKIPTVMARDAFNQTLTVDLKVYRDYELAGQEEIAHNEYFTPEQAGEYTIVYSATDYLGQTTILKKQVTVYGENAYANELKWTYEFVGNEEYTDLIVGKYIGIEECQWTGGAGSIQTSIDVYDPNGDVVKIFRNKNILMFFAEEAGQYIVEYRAIDYLGQEVVYTKELDVIDSTAPVLKDAIILPDYVIDGITMTLPSPIAYDYQEGKEVAPIITVQDGNGESVLNSTVYTPSIVNHGDIVTITYKYGSTIITDTAIGLKAKTEETGLDMCKYFVATAGELVADTKCITYTTNTPDSILTFSKAIPVSGFKFVYNIGASIDEIWGNAAFNGVEITLSDSADPYYKVKLQFVASGNEVLFSINNGNPVKTVGSFTAESLVDLQFSYASATHDIFNIKGTKIGTIKNYLTGEQFEGFTSGKVYMAIRLMGVSGDSSIRLYSINEQPLSSTAFDRIKPTIISKSDIGAISLGDTVDVFTAYATDILSNVGEVVVNVKSPDGLYVTAKDGTVLKNVPATKVYQFVCEQVGTYDIRYSVKDSAGNNGQLKRLINVADKEAPVVTLKGNVPEKAKENATVELPQVTVEDATECTVSLMIYDPYSATYTSVSDYKYTFTKKGTYTVRYFVFDSFYNCVIMDYKIVVS